MITSNARQEISAQTVLECTDLPCMCLAHCALESFMLAGAVVCAVVSCVCRRLCSSFMLLVLLADFLWKHVSIWKCLEMFG